MRSGWCVAAPCPKGEQPSRRFLPSKHTLEFGPFFSVATGRRPYSSLKARGALQFLPHHAGAFVSETAKSHKQNPDPPDLPGLPGLPGAPA